MTEDETARYMLDTNTVSYLIKGHQAMIQRLSNTAPDTLCISSITEGELRFGLAKRPEAKRLHILVEEFLRHVDVLAWGRKEAARYGAIRAVIESQGITLSPLDMLIASHALTAKSVLVTSDKAFQRVPDLPLEDWSI